jgi:hypothetical protein
MELLTMHLHRLGAAEAKLVTFLADGAPWVWDRVDWVVQRVGLKQDRVVQVLDWCHAVHHVSLALEALGLKDEERQRRYRELRSLLKKGRAYRVTAELSLLAEEQPPESEAWTAIRYLEKHAEAGRLRYRQFRKRGVPMGSGAIESAIRRVVNLRLKGNGMLWQEENAEAMLALRAAALTDRWEETLAHARAAMARDRRVDWRWHSPDLPEELKAKKTNPPPSPQGQLEKAAANTAA